MPTLLTAPIAPDLDPDRDDLDPPAQVSRLPERYEVIHGEIREASPMSSYAGEVAHRLNRAVDQYLVRNPVGEGGVERAYRIPQPNDPGRNRIPDWSYVSYERWPADRPYPFTGNARDVVPDVAAEVVSPTDAADELLAKVREYLRGGVRLVWVVYPLAREVHAYWPGANTVRTYSVGDDLDAGDILPGFRAAVGPLFPPVAPPPTP